MGVGRQRVSEAARGLGDIRTRHVERARNLSQSRERDIERERERERERQAVFTRVGRGERTAGL